MFSEWIDPLNYHACLGLFRPFGLAFINQTNLKCYFTPNGNITPITCANHNQSIYSYTVYLTFPANNVYDCTHTELLLLSGAAVIDCRHWWWHYRVKTCQRLFTSVCNTELDLFCEQTQSIPLAKRSERKTNLNKNLITQLHPAVLLSCEDFRHCD